MAGTPQTLPPLTCDDTIAVGGERKQFQITYLDSTKSGLAAGPLAAQSDQIPADTIPTGDSNSVFGTPDGADLDGVGHDQYNTWFWLKNAKVQDAVRGQNTITTANGCVYIQDYIINIVQK